MYKIKQFFLSLCAVAAISCSVNYASTTPTNNTQVIREMERCQSKEYCKTITELARELNRIRESTNDVSKQKQQIKNYLENNNTLDWQILLSYKPFSKLNESQTDKLNGILKSFYLEAFSTELQKMRLTEYVDQKQNWDGTILVHFNAIYNKKDIIVQWVINPKSSTIRSIKRKGYDYSYGMTHYESNIYHTLARAGKNNEYCQLKDKSNFIDFIENLDKPMHYEILLRKFKIHLDCELNIDRFREYIESLIKRSSIKP